MIHTICMKCGEEVYGHHWCDPKKVEAMKKVKEEFNKSLIPALRKWHKKHEGENS